MHDKKYRFIAVLMLLCFLQLLTYPLPIRGGNMESGPEAYDVREEEYSRNLSENVNTESEDDENSEEEYLRNLDEDMDPESEYDDTGEEGDSLDLVEDAESELNLDDALEDSLEDAGGEDVIEDPDESIESELNPEDAEEEDVIEESVESIKLEASLKTGDGEEYQGGWTNQDVEVIVTECNQEFIIFYLIWESGQPEDEGIVTPEAPVFQEDGEYNIRIWAEDEEGNRSNPENDIIREIKIDKTKPKIFISYIEEEPGIDGIYFAFGRRLVITVEELNFSGEEVSFINHGMTSFAGDLSEADWEHLEDGISHTTEIFLGNGQYAFQLRCEDSAGNIEVLEKQEFIIDMEIPVLDFSKSQEDLIAWNRDIKYTALSGLSGIRKIDLYKDDTFLETIYRDDTNGLTTGTNTVKRSGITTACENGTYSYQIFSKSGLSSEIIHGASYSNIDRQKPIIKVNKNGYQEGMWTSDTVTLEVENETGNLGSSVYFYRTHTNESWIEFDGILEITENTETTFYFYMESEAQYRTKQDKEDIAKEDKAFAQAICSVQSVQVKVDKTDPEDLSVKYNSVEVSSYQQSSAFGFFFKDTVIVTLEARDDFSGIKSFEVILSGKGGEDITKEIIVESLGPGTATVQFSIEPQFVGKISASASDMAELSIPKSGKNQYAALAVDSKMPTSPRIQTDGYVSGKWTNQDISLLITGAEADSGIDYYEYTKTAGMEPEKSAEWTILPAGRKEDATLSDPGNVTESTLSLERDSNFTYYFRGVSNSGIKGDFSSYEVNLQKTIPPGGQLILNSPNEKGWYQQTPTVEFLVPEPTPAPVALYYKIWCFTEGESEESASEVLFFGSNYPDFTREGIYFLRVWTLDGAGNRSDPQQDILREIRIDRIKPKAFFELNPGRGEVLPYYNKLQVGEIMLEETNFIPENCNLLVTATLNGEPIPAPSFSGWNSTGDKHNGYLSFLEDGDYEVHITCEDAAGTMLEEEIIRSFTIDTGLPQVKIQGLAPGSANKEPVSPVILCSDVNLDRDRMDITLEGFLGGTKVIRGSFSEEGDSRIFQMNPILEDDIYTLSVTSYDKAGNEKKQLVIFSVNQNGAVFAFEQKDIQGDYTNQPFFPSIKVWDVDHISIVSLTMNGKEVPYEFENGILTIKEKIYTDGKYVIALDVLDGAGNRSSMKPVEFYFDSTKPVVHILGVKQGNYYFGPVTVQMIPDNPEDFVKEIRMNGELLSQEDYILKEDGSVEIQVSGYEKYILEVAAEDRAGNESDIQTVSFELTNNWFLRLVQNIKSFFAFKF